MYTFINIMNKVHDASGLDSPQLYYWERGSNNSCYYPTRKITSDELHEEIRTWMEDNNLPECSLDELTLEDLTPTQRIYRNFFLNIFDIQSM